MRVKDWEKRLNEIVRKHQKLPSVYGVSDCWLIPSDAYEAVTGEKLYEGVSYTSEQGAAKQLLQRGFQNVADAFAAKLEEISPSLAHRGDLGVVDNDGQICGGVFISVGFMSRDDDKVIFLPPSRVKIAFKVGR